jgi:MFS family permease
VRNGRVRTSAARLLATFVVDRRALAIPAYRRLWIASVISAVGGSFSVVAVPAQLFTVTGSSAAVGASGAVSFVALVVTGLGSGVLADVKDRRKVLLAAQWGLGFTYVGLWTQAMLDGRSVPILMMLVACQGLSLGAIMTTAATVLPRLVPVELLPAANGLNSLVRYAGSALGPVLAGALIPLVRLGTLYLFDAVALLAAGCAVAALPPLPPSPIGSSKDQGSPTIGQLLAGFRYLAASRLLLAVVAVDLAAMVFGMPTALFPELAHRVYGGPPDGGSTLGLLYAAYPTGVFVLGLMSGTITRARRHGSAMAVAATVWGISVVVLGLAGQLWTALAALVLGGAVNFVLSTHRNAISQALMDDALRGRIQGSLTVVLIGGPQIANLLHGAAASIFGPQLVICIGGLLTTVTTAVIVWSVPELRRYTQVRQVTEPTGGARPSR